MKTNLPQLIDRIKEQHSNELPFMLYASPHANEITTYLQNDLSTYKNVDFCHHGVIMAPFMYDDNEFCIPKEYSEILYTSLPANLNIEKAAVEIPEDKNEKAKYTALVSAAIKETENPKTEKIVTSRKKEITLSKIDLSAIIHRVFGLYPDAFRYLWYHPSTGIWCGATPEILLVTKGTSFKTMALAGTQKIIGNRKPIWSYKEKREQSIVTNAIAESLEKITQVVKISRPYSHQAGTLVHIRTDIEGVVKKSKATLKDIAIALHPTPAVCGTPEYIAKNFIKTHEGYNREFYTGFIGTIDTENNTGDLYVNLRCMKIEENKATLYVGGGITSDSKPELEWEETHNKLQTMLQVLQPML